MPIGDVIVIDEAHNVAQRGHGSSLRAKLAKLLARRSDTLIMLFATPHDGKARSFASLMNMRLILQQLPTLMIIGRKILKGCT